MADFLAQKTDMGALEPSLVEAHFDELCALLDAKGQKFITAHKAFFMRVIEGSNFLTRLMKAQSDILTARADKSFIDIFDAELVAFRVGVAQCANRDAIITHARCARARLSLIIALADISGEWTLTQTTNALSDFADAATLKIIDWLLDEGHRQKQLTQPLAQADSGLVILAMGKHGSRELNFSSDIDLVIFYDSHYALPLSSAVDARQFYIWLVRELVQILQTPTRDGHVWRVDLRLRPDPGATPIVISTDAALSYYEAMGQNWERAAFIKARAIGGTPGAAQAFLEAMTPFIWRRYLDYAALEDVHAMKRQYHALRGHGAIAIGGHDIKLGRGGIREIEFFVQTQQLITGGRNAQLRGRDTRVMLDALAAGEWISHKTADALKRAYETLRQIEHRLQMRFDEQTHELPRNEEDLIIFARFAGYRDFTEFSQNLKAVLGVVQDEYDKLFEMEGDGAVSELRFDGDAAAQAVQLEALGFTRIEAIVQEIMGWQAGRVRATRSARARTLLARLLPQIMALIARAAAPDDAFMRFTNFLEGLPSGVQLFSLFQSKPQILTLLIDIISAAPRLATWLAHDPMRLDIMLDGDFWDAMTGDDMGSALELALMPHLGEDDKIEAILDETRIFIHERQFRLGVQILAHPADAVAKATAFSELADAAITQISAHIGAPLGVRYVILGLGKLGGREMSIESDIDLIMIYDMRDAVDGDIARHARAIVSGLTVQTSFGGLYEVDMRLRPSGNAGPVATKLSSFIEYQQQKAWVWEHMALTRARVIAGDAGLATHLQAQITDILRMKRDGAVLIEDMLAMRSRLLAHHRRGAFWSCKHGVGGLVDIEFLVQCLQLRHGAETSAILHAHTKTSLTRLHEGGFLSDGDYHGLFEAHHIFSTIGQLERLCFPKARAGVDDVLPPASELLFSAAMNCPPGRIEAAISDLRAQVASIFAARFIKSAEGD